MKQEKFYEDRIFYRLTSFIKEEVFDENTVSIPFLDAAITFHYLLNCQEKGISSFCITEGLMEEWELTAADLMRYAKQNTPRLFPAVIKPIEEILEAGEEEREETSGTGESEIYVLTNSIGTFGAAALLYPGVLRQFAEGKKADLYVLPSSVHEVILLPRSAAVSVEQLDRLIQEMNDSQVPEEEILSDQVQCFSWRKERFLTRRREGFEEETEPEPGEKKEPEQSDGSADI